MKSSHVSLDIISLFIVNNSIHCVIYLFLKFSALFLLEITINRSITDCKRASETDIVIDVKRCLTEFQRLVSNLGPLLLTLMSIDSFSVMMNSFMLYLTCIAQMYVHTLNFALCDLSGIFSLIYICVLCTKCSSSVKILLIPLRFGVKF
jgi:hypothetical protein